MGLVVFYGMERLFARGGNSLSIYVVFVFDPYLYLYPCLYDVCVTICPLYNPFIKYELYMISNYVGHPTQGALEKQILKVYTINVYLKLSYIMAP